VQERRVKIYGYGLKLKVERSWEATTMKKGPELKKGGGRKAKASKTSDLPFNGPIALASHTELIHGRG